MTRILRNFSKLFFWLAGLALIAHLIIPHDHHIADSFPEQNNNCPVENNQGDNHKGFPIHCQAFNHLAADKAGKYINGDKHKNLKTDYNCASEILVAPFSDVLKVICNYNTPVINHFFVDFLQLRAPPSIT